ncbi:c-type cytochrome biogenesis protein CcmI [Rhizobiales bacterium]|uniref:c-type cytochrome biogenesis protein CcmI n=1 Tax=Hongsoonwoonella zoysiae TaxID=2821844 RepID=UPI0015611565|nr:c-type cytochrome biogenesis protein CcmI [Hongsoonwoonella zoysiae]NRG19378.1 c-type cytochrome biogenesis protein CcmI [Hongsoonwoonella zoysiae]
MIIWIVFAILTAFAALSILVPMARARAGDGERASHDAEVYRAQLGEIDKDLERGLIDEESAQAARTEIARRLIAAAKPPEGGEKGRPGSGLPLRLAQLAAIVFVPLAAIGLYLELGAPNLPDQPLAERLAARPTQQDLPLLIARVEKHLSDNPQDGQGWDVLAPVYMRMGRTSDAAAAYRNAIRILGPTVDRQSNLGEALTMANQGIVSADARAAFERAVEIDERAIKPRFFLALALGQEGKNDEAAAAWKSILDEAQGNEPWVPAALAELEKVGGEPPQRFARSGPSAGDVAAASQMSEADRAQMIEGMVAGLEERLRSEGGDAEEWVRLIRAYTVLGRQDKAMETFELAAASFEDDPAALDKLKAARQALETDPDEGGEEPTQSN